MAFPQLRQFQQQQAPQIRRRVRGQQPFPKDKVEAGHRFAEILVETLKAHGLATYHEKDPTHEPDCVFKCDTCAEVPFKIKTDAIILGPKNQRLIALEFKYMESGLYWAPDVKKIVFDYLHLRRNFPKTYYIVISGAKLMAGNNFRTPLTLKHYTDHLIDLDIHRSGWENRLEDCLALLHKILRSTDPIPQPPILPPCTLTTWYERENEPIKSNRNFLERNSGKAFERRVEKLFVKAEIPFEMGAPSTPHSYPLLDLWNSKIPIEADFYIPNRKNPRFIIECKNRSHLDKQSLAEVIFDAWHIKNMCPTVQFGLLIGNRLNHKIPPYLEGYLDFVAYENAIPKLIEHLQQISIS